MHDTTIRVDQTDARAIDNARDVISRLVDAGLRSDIHGESLVLLADDLEAIQSKIKAQATTDTRCEECGGVLEGWAGERHSPQCSKAERTFGRVLNLVGGRIA